MYLSKAFHLNHVYRVHRGSRKVGTNTVLVENLSRGEMTIITTQAVARMPVEQPQTHHSYIYNAFFHAGIYSSFQRYMLATNSHYLIIIALALLAHSTGRSQPMLLIDQG